MLSELHKKINNETHEKIKVCGSLRERYILCLKEQGIRKVALAGIYQSGCGIKI